MISATGGRRPVGDGERAFAIMLAEQKGQQVHTIFVGFLGRLKVENKEKAYWDEKERQETQRAIAELRLEIMSLQERVERLENLLIGQARTIRMILDYEQMVKDR